MDNSESINFPSIKNREEQVDIDLDILNETIEYIRPAVQADGGDIKLASVDNGVVNIEMLGACVGCPLSIATLKSGIERILKEKVPGVEEVIASEAFDDSRILEYKLSPNNKLFSINGCRIYLIL